MKIKLCGFWEKATFQLALKLRPDFIGFIFYAPSHRYLSPQAAHALTSPRGAGCPKRIGVFVDAPLEEILTNIDCAGLDGVQLHGNEAPALIKNLRQIHKQLIIWKAFRIKDAQTLSDAKQRYGNLFSAGTYLDALLLDAFSSQVYGGSGTLFKHKLIAAWQALGQRLVLAGGITAANLPTFLQYKSYALDVSSELETAKHKDAVKLKTFMKTFKTLTQTTAAPHKAFNMDYLKARHFGKYGGRYVPELLIPALDQLETAFSSAQQSTTFKNQLSALLRDFGGRPTPLSYAANLTAQLGGAKIYLKNEGALHTGAHKLNNVLGQTLLTQTMGKTEVIAETGAGQHGLAVAAACAKLQLKAKIFMGSVDLKRQYPNVAAMRLMGAEVIPVTAGSQTLKDAVNAAMKYWIEHLNTAHYVLGSALGPYPYPLMVREFQRVIGEETRAAILEREGKLPACILACTGGGSNALGMFVPFLNDAEVTLIGVEAGGRGSGQGDHAARMMSPCTGIAQGYKSFFLQTPDGQLTATHSISAGLDYPGIAPELAHLFDVGRVQFLQATDDEALAGYQLLARHEGILPALESAHAVSQLPEIVRRYGSEDIVVVNISGRGDKDLFITMPQLNGSDWKTFLSEQVEQIK